MRQERKLVTVLFCDLVGFTSRAEVMDPEDVAALLAPYQARLKHELDRHGGTVEKFIGDAVMALFGAPSAHEDDAERAVRAALAIRDFALEEGIELRIGVTTGEALVSVDARPDRGETMATGDVVNTAARLQTAAPVNGILVGEATYRATNRAIEYEPVDPVEAKGKVQPVRGWRALATRARIGVDVSQAGRAPLVGREQERDLLAAALARARREHQPQLVTLVGVPGIGKSRLVHELYRIVDEDPELVVWRQGRSLPYGEGVAFWALGEIVKAQAGILETAGAQEAEQKLAAAVRDICAQSDADWIEESLRPLVGLGGADEQGLERRAMTFAAWRRFFEALATPNPTVLVFEDLQWADDGLLDFVDELVDRVTGVPLLVVCNTRPELLERRPGWGGGKRNALTVSLAPLSDDETARLVAALLERSVLPADEQALLLQRAGGNPLFAEEYARMLADGGHAPAGVPQTLQGVVAARIDALPSAEKELLQDAAVLGKVFWSDALAALSGLEGWELEDRLHALERKEFVRREQRSAVAGATQYAFVHVLVRDGAYGQMPRAARAQAHLRVADWIDSLPPDRSEDRAEMLAHHLVQAVEYGSAAGQDVGPATSRAALALRDAGDRAWSLSALAAALDLYERAQALDPEAAGDPRMLLRLGRALALVRGQGDDELAQAAASLADSDPATAAEAELLWGESIWQRGDQQGSFVHFERAARIVASLPPARQKLFVVSQVARFLTLAGRAREGLEHIEEAIEMAEMLGDVELLADSLNTRGVLRTIVADERWLEDLERALQLALEANSWRAGRAYINLASTLLQDTGEIVRAEALMREGLEFAESIGLGLAARWSRSNLTDALFHLGRWDEALSIVDHEIANPEPHYMQATCRRNRALIRLARGDVTGAREDVEVGLAHSRSIRDPQDMIPGLVWHAFCLSRLGDSGGAAASVTELAKLRAEWEQPALYGPAAVLLAYVGADLGGEVARELLIPLESGWQRAAAAVVAGEFPSAADHLAAMQAWAFEADARLAAARSLREEGRNVDAEEQLAAASAFYRSVGAKRYLAEAESLLAAAS
jgi:class 3 adenylate cyclase/tetratricopeptide (TPR) repeat protein